MQVRGQVPEQEVQRFWEERYCAGLMRLVVVGPQPLRELEALVCARFGAVRNLGAAVPAFSGAPLTTWRLLPCCAMLLADLLCKRRGEVKSLVQRRGMRCTWCTSWQCRRLGVQSSICGSSMLSKHSPPKQMA